MPVIWAAKTAIRREDDAFAPVRQGGVVGVLDRISGHVVGPDVSEGRRLCRWRPSRPRWEWTRRRRRRGLPALPRRDRPARRHRPTAPCAPAAPRPPRASPPRSPASAGGGGSRPPAEPAAAAAAAVRACEDSVRRRPASRSSSVDHRRIRILTGLPGSLTFADVAVRLTSPVPGLAWAPEAQPEGEPSAHASAHCQAGRHGTTTKAATALASRRRRGNPRLRSPAGPIVIDSGSSP